MQVFGHLSALFVYLTTVKVLCAHRHYLPNNNGGKIDHGY
jgi:hypothetical protein